MYPTAYDLSLFNELVNRYVDGNLNLVNFITGDYFLYRHERLRVVSSFLKDSVTELVSIDFTGCDFSSHSEEMLDLEIQPFLSASLENDSSFNMLLSGDQFLSPCPGDSMELCWIDSLINVVDHEALKQMGAQEVAYQKNQESLVPDLMALLNQVKPQKLIFRDNQIEESDVALLCKLFSELPLVELVFDHPKAGLGKNALKDLLDRQVLFFQPIIVGDAALQDELNTHFNDIQLLNAPLLNKAVLEAIDQKNADWLIRLFYHHLLAPDPELLNWDKDCVPPEYRKNYNKLCMTWKKQTILFSSEQLTYFLYDALNQNPPDAKCISVFFKLADPSPGIVLFELLTGIAAESVLMEINQAVVADWVRDIIELGHQLKSLIEDRDRLKFGFNAMSNVCDHALKKLETQHVDNTPILQLLFLLSSLAYCEIEYINYVEKIIQWIDADNDTTRLGVINEMFKIAIDRDAALLEKDACKNQTNVISQPEGQACKKALDFYVQFELHHLMQKIISTIQEGLINNIRKQNFQCVPALHEYDEQSTEQMFWDDQPPLQAEYSFFMKNKGRKEDDSFEEEFVSCNSL